MKTRNFIFVTLLITIISSFSSIAAVPVSKSLPNCTVTATVKVMGSSVTISSTKATCEEAANDVKAGIRALLNKK